jgi:hypothetical protein
VNQDLGSADDQSNPRLGRVQKMDPFGIGFHASKDTTAGKPSEEVVSRLPAGESKEKIPGPEPEGW